jgi:hypothetical protein
MPNLSEKTYMIEKGIAMKINLQKKERCYLSQFGQDGIIEAVFDLIKPTNKFFVEFGSAGSACGGNTAYLRLFGFDGLLMDRSPIPYNDVTAKKIFDVKIHFVNAENINSLLKSYSVPEEMDFLSIDIDGNDYWVWKTIEYKPRVVCIEANYSIPYDRNIVQSYIPDDTWNGSSRFGASFKALFTLARQKKYSLVAVSGCDMIFIRDDSIPPDIEIEGINDLAFFCDKESYNNLAKDTYEREKHMEWDRWVELDDNPNSETMED